MTRHERIAEHLEHEHAKPTLPVLFRVWRDTGDVIAVFPTLPGTYEPDTCLSYEHVGQHGACRYSVILTQTRPLRDGEGRELGAELRSIYNDVRLVLIKRVTRKHIAERQAALSAMA